MRAEWLDTRETIPTHVLHGEGVTYTLLPLTGFQAGLDALTEERGYVKQDEVHLHPGTPELETICAKFDREHLHDDDEVRFVLEGEGIFDIRSSDDRYMRVLVSPGDLIVVPAGRNHRFLLTEARTIRAVRLFKDQSGWVPRYRGGSGHVEPGEARPSS